MLKSQKEWQRKSTILRFALKVGPFFRGVGSETYLRRLLRVLWYNFYQDFLLRFFSSFCRHSKKVLLSPFEKTKLQI
jgi:hypothetical protein